MPINNPVSLGVPGTTSLVLTLDTPVSAGEPIIVICWVANIRTWSPPTDSAGNIYEILRTVGAGTARTMIIAYCPNPAPLVVGNTIQGNISSSTVASRTCIAMKITGLANPAFDKAAGVEPTTSSSYSIGPTATLEQPEEIAVYCVAQDTETDPHVPEASWTVLLDYATTQSTAARIGVGYKKVQSTSPITATGTMANGQYVGVLGTFKAGVVTQRHRTKSDGSFTAKSITAKIGNSFVTKPHKTKTGGIFE